MNFAAYYSLFIGMMIIIQWVFFILTGNVPEFTTAFWEIIFHIIVEFLTAFILLITGWGILTKHKGAIQVNLVAQGMLIYSVINSAGYFTQQGEWIFLIMFFAIIVFSLISVLKLLKAKIRISEKQID